MNRLNKFFNLQMKNIIVMQRLLTIACTKLFHHTTLTRSYYIDFKVIMKAIFDKHTNSRHQIKDASQKVYYLAYQIAISRSIIKQTHE